MTFGRYRTLLEALFIVKRIPPWYRNIGKRLVKSPKMYFLDTPLMCHILGIEISTAAKENPSLFGKVCENFIASELLKQLTLFDDISLYHFRTQSQEEVDFVLERRDGAMIGIEVKCGESVNNDHFKGLKVLQASAGDQFRGGFVFYGGDHVLPFGKDLWAVPISILWS